MAEMEASPNQGPRPGGDQGAGEGASGSVSGPIWLLRHLLPGALGLALIMWLILWTAFPVFVVPIELATYAGPAPTAEEAAAEAAAGVWARALNASLAGVLLGIAFACLIAGTARTKLPLMRRLLLALLVGIVLGCVAGLVAHFLAESHRIKQLEPLQANVVSQAGLMMLLGAAVGLMGAIQNKAGRDGIFGGFIGGLLAAVLYPLLTAFLLPSANTSLVVPREPLSKLIWVLLIFVMISATAVGVSSRRGRRVVEQDATA